MPCDVKLFIFSLRSFKIILKNIHPCNDDFQRIQSRVRISKNLSVVQVERKLRDISKKEAGKGVILKHLNMATR